jgi:hypothetical protein
MKLSKTNVQTELAQSADKLDKLCKDVMFYAEDAARLGLMTLQTHINDAQAGKSSFLEAASATKALAEDMQVHTDALEAVSLEEQEAELDGMIEALLALRGQARRTGLAVDRHLQIKALEEDETLPQTLQS